MPNYHTRARSEGSASGVLMPTSSQNNSASTQNGHLGGVHLDSTYSSKEHRAHHSMANSLYDTTPPPREHNRHSLSLTGALQQLDLRSPTSTASTSSTGGVLLASEHQSRNMSQVRPPAPRSSINPVKCYDIDQEEPPESIFFRSDFETAFKQSKDLVRQLANTLLCSKLYEDTETTVHALHVDAQNAAEYQAPRAWKIGLVGDSGVG